MLFIRSTHEREEGMNRFRREGREGRRKKNETIGRTGRTVGL
jgi:hypothetical protein